MTIDFDLDEPEEQNDDTEVESENRPARRRSSLRSILLLLISLVILCVVCFILIRNFGGNVVGVLPIPGAPTNTPVVAPPTAPATEEVVGEEPPQEPAEPAPEATEPAEEEPAPGPEVETPVAEEPSEQPTATLPTATAAPAPGPTSTAAPEEGAAPTVIVTVENCGDNTPPTADANGPYTAMMGKGQAVVVFDGSGSTDSDGTIGSYEWDFGDGSDPESGQSVTHGYTSPGGYVATLKVTDNCGAMAEVSVDVTITGPTPPSDNGGTDDDDTSTPTPTAAAPASASMGFCYRVRYGDTLSGIAYYYGLSLRTLAAVNAVPLNYFVIAGQGLFIPMGEIGTGPNVYQVQAGDTLNSIAYHCGLTVATLADINGLTTDANLSPGDLVIIPPWSQVYP
jgi:LysM repeat protein